MKKPYFPQLFYSLIITAFLSACAAPPQVQLPTQAAALPPSPTATKPPILFPVTAVPTAPPATGMPAITSPTNAATLTATAKPAESPVAFVWSITGDPYPFITPDGLAVDLQGNLYVMDSGNNQAQKFDSDGHFITKWGSKGKGNGQFGCLNICMLAVDRQGHVYVTDSDNARVQKFDGNGKFLAKWGSFGAGDGQLNSPFGIAVDQQGNVYVGDVGNARIQKFDGNGKFIMKWGSSGSGPGQFSADLADIAVDSQGNVYVTDRSNGIAKFDSKGQFIAKVDTCGDDKPIYRATGVAFDDQENLYVFDLTHMRICKYDSQEHYLNHWDNSGSRQGPLSIVGGIAVDHEGNVYLAELFDNRVLKFRQL
jgi:tripartite motif-containing protein 71